MQFLSGWLNIREMSGIYHFCRNYEYNNPYKSWTSISLSTNIPNSYPICKQFLSNNTLSMSIKKIYPIVYRHPNPPIFPVRRGAVLVSRPRVNHRHPLEISYWHDSTLMMFRPWWIRDCDSWTAFLSLLSNILSGPGCCLYPVWHGRSAQKHPRFSSPSGSPVLTPGVRKTVTNDELSPWSKNDMAAGIDAMDVLCFPATGGHFHKIFLAFFSHPRAVLFFICCYSAPRDAWYLYRWKSCDVTIIKEDLFFY